jgi:hypothetical protein
LENLSEVGNEGRAFVARYVWRKLLLSSAAGAFSYVLLLWLHGPWEGFVAVTLIGSVIGIANRSRARILVGSSVCATGWLLGPILFGVWIELGVGAGLVAGAFLGAAFSADRRLWPAIPEMLLGSVAGLLAEVSRYLTVRVTWFCGLGMQLLRLLSAGLLWNIVAAVMAPSFMERLDPTFDRSKRLQHHLQYAQSLGLGQPDLGKTEILGACLVSWIQGALEGP